MKKVLSIIAMLFCIVLLSSQNYPYPFIMKCEPDKPQHGISKDMVYEAIISTKNTQKELINNTKKFFFELGLIDSTKVNIDEISNNQSQFKLKFGFRQGLFYGKGKTAIAKRLKHATYLNFDAIFNFSTTGKVSIKFTNFEEVFFTPIVEKGDNYYYGYSITDYVFSGDEKTYYGPWNGDSRKDLMPENDPGVKSYIELKSLEKAAFNTGTLLGKAMTVYDAGSMNTEIKFGWGGVKVTHSGAVVDAFANLTKELNAQFEVFKKAQENKIGGFISTAGMIQLYENIENETSELIKQRTEENYLIIVDNERWEKYFQSNFNDIFLVISLLNDGELLGIHKDGVPAFEYVKDKFKEIKVTKKQ